MTRSRLDAKLSNSDRVRAFWSSTEATAVTITCLVRLTNSDGSFFDLVLGGLDIFVGPGALLAELSFGWGGVDAFVLRDTNVGSLNLAVGYRLMI